MRRCVLEADVITNNASISACEKGHQWALALQILARMLRVVVDDDALAVVGGGCGNDLHRFIGQRIRLGMELDKPQITFQRE